MKKIVIVLFAFLILMTQTGYALQNPQIYFTKTTTGLAVPATYTFTFSLWDYAVGGMPAYWWETKTISMTTKTLTTYLGSVTDPIYRSDTLANVDFSKQYWVQVDKHEANGTLTQVGSRTKFNVVPYAMWSAQGGDVNSVTAGNGLVSTGATGDITLSVKAATGIIVDTNGVSIGSVADSALSSNVVKLNNDQTITGTKTFNPVSSSAPFAVAGGKTTMVTNLNADMVDSRHAADFATAAHGHDSSYVNETGDTMTGALNLSIGASASFPGALRINGSYGAAGTGRSIIFGDATNYVRLRDVVEAGGQVGFSIDTAGIQSRLYIKHGGNIGIGTTVPNEQLEITGNFRLPATTASTGIIRQGPDTLIHTYGNASNFFAGLKAGNLSMTGTANTATGYTALAGNTAGSSNTAYGAYSLFSNTTAGRNTAMGRGALYKQSFSNGGTIYDTKNTAVGYHALYSNQPTTIGNGVYNTALGSEALSANTTGKSNSAVGERALGMVTSGSYNLALGVSAGLSQTTGSDNIYIGYLVTGVAGESNVIRIGRETHTRAYIGGIYNSLSAAGVPVYVNSNEQLGTILSSRKFKEDIKDMGNATDRLMKLRPVTFYYKPEYADGSNLLQYGLVAEEVAEVYPDLVQYDNEGNPYTVRYHFVNAMLLNEVQKQHRENEVQKEQIRTLEERLARLEALLNGK